MTSTAAESNSMHCIDLGPTISPVALSSVQLPTQPSSSTSTDAFQKYTHVLPLKAISPQMDLIAILSRDVASPSTGSINGSSALNPSSVLAPPPPGMSAAANQARIRMMMMARARALAAAGMPANAPGPSVEVPRVTKCASIRLSLWRMASLAGEQGSRVWDVEIKVPNLFNEADKDVREMEDLSVSSLSWSPDSRSIAIIVITSRRVADWTHRRHNRFLVVYDMQDGRQRRVIRIPDTCGKQSPNEEDLGLEWRQLASTRSNRAVPGSARYILRRMKDLPDNSHSFEEKDSKAKQRQRAFNAMRNTSSQKQGEVDRKYKEEMLFDQVDWSMCLLDHPRSDTPDKGSDEMDDSVALLCAWESHRIHLFLDASIYLGSIEVNDQIHAINIVSKSGAIALCSSKPGGLTLQRIHTGLEQQSTHFSTLLHLESLSTEAFNLLTYCYDCIIDIRNLYRTTHINCITPWIRKARTINKQYSTHFETEMQILLLTSSANEAITSLLVGNETMTEGDLKKMKAEIASACVKLETLVESVFQALQRVKIVFVEVQGCWQWQEKYSSFLSGTQGKVIESILDLFSRCQKQSLGSLRHVQQEMNCWSQFYKWFMYERSRQEAIRDQVAEAKTDISYNVLLIATFLQRGFFNQHLERSIGIVLDKKTRGTFVEDDEEEEEGETGGTGADVQEDSSIVGQSRDSNQDHISKQNGKEITIDDLLEMQKQMQANPSAEKTLEPSQNDLSCLLSAPFLLTTSCKGLQDRQHNSVRETSNLFTTVKEILQLSSTLFSQAFSAYASHQNNTSTVDVTMNQSLLPLRSDALLSVAPTATKSSTGEESNNTKNCQLLRSCFDQSTGQQWLLGMSSEGDSSSSVVSVIKHISLHNSTKTSSVQCQGKIIDMGLYSTREVVLLLKDDNLTRIVSFQLDSLDFTASTIPSIMPLQRSYKMLSHQIGSGALQLSLNHAKDVAATLDDQGVLIYWDFVLLGEQDEDYEMV